MGGASLLREVDPPVLDAILVLLYQLLVVPILHLLSVLLLLVVLHTLAHVLARDVIDVFLGEIIHVFRVFVRILVLFLASFTAFLGSFTHLIVFTGKLGFLFGISRLQLLQARRLLFFDVADGPNFLVCSEKKRVALTANDTSDLLVALLKFVRKGNGNWMRNTSSVSDAREAELAESVAAPAKELLRHKVLDMAAVDLVADLLQLIDAINTERVAPKVLIKLSDSLALYLVVYGHIGGISEANARNEVGHLRLVPFSDRRHNDLPERQEVARSAFQHLDIVQLLDCTALKLQLGTLRGLSAESCWLGVPLTRLSRDNVHLTIIAQQSDLRLS